MDPRKDVHSDTGLLSDIGLLRKIAILTGLSS